MLNVTCLSFTVKGVGWWYPCVGVLSFWVRSSSSCFSDSICSNPLMFVFPFSAYVRLLMALTIVSAEVKVGCVIYLFLTTPCPISLSFLFSLRKLCGIGTVLATFQCTIHWLCFLPMLPVWLELCAFGLHSLGVQVACNCNQMGHVRIGAPSQWGQNLTVVAGSRWVLFVVTVYPTISLGKCHLLLVKSFLKQFLKVWMALSAMFLRWVFGGTIFSVQFFFISCLNL
jgi:hypothetical protein